jgi:hypothetical protein
LAGSLLKKRNYGMILFFQTGMKWFYILFLVAMSLAEAIFTLCYCSLTGTFDLVPVVGLVLYLGSVAFLRINYNLEQYKNERKALLDGLLSQSRSVEKL